MGEALHFFFEDFCVDLIEFGGVVLRLLYLLFQSVRQFVVVTLELFLDFLQLA